MKNLKEKIKKNTGIVFIVVLLLLVVLSQFFFINGTRSMPQGLYMESSLKSFEKGNTYLLKMPSKWNELAKERGYSFYNKDLLKRLVAVEGDEVTIKDSLIYINGEATTAIIQDKDTMNREIHSDLKEGVLKKGELLFLTDAIGSFDGRYIGLTNKSNVFAEAHLIYEIHPVHE